jgi:SAM-dependent methyltransferase
MEPTDLCKIMGECGSDKGDININESWHNYTLIYNKLFENKRNDKLRVFELGLGSNNPNILSNMCWYKKCRPGASLYGWSEYFKNADIFGADIDKDILFQTDRIKTYYCDQTEPEDIKKLWNQTDLVELFDIIIEDGLHEYNANVCFFENSIHKLKLGGIYIIEDIMNNTIIQWEQKIKEWEQKYIDLNFQLVILPSSVNKSDNILLIVQFNLMDR